MPTILYTPRQPGKASIWALAMLASHRVTPLRACALCLHSTGPQTGPDLICNAPQVRDVLPPRARTCLAARATNGPCGPNARHLDMHAWQTHRSSSANNNGASQQP